MSNDSLSEALPPLPTLDPGLYRHYKGGWYEVLHTVRCSETLQGMTLYRALYSRDGATGNPHEVWVRPTAMFGETVPVNGNPTLRFTPHDPATVALCDAATARAVGWVLGQRLQQAGHTLRRPPPEPTTCCGRGCNGCVWEGFFAAMQHWRSDALALLGQPLAT